MSTAPAAHLLAPPTPNSPVVPDHLVCALNAHLNSRYCDVVWPLGAMTDNPSAPKRAIHWHRCPPGKLQEQLRLVAWTMINGELRPRFLADRGSRLRARLSVNGVAESVEQWINLAKWLAGQGISTLSACDSSLLHTYGQHLQSGGGRNRVEKILIAVTRLWAFDQLSAHPSGIGRPPWDDHGVDDYLPAATSTTGENTTEPVVEQTMGPLLIWAMRTVEDFADDILTAFAEHQRLNEAADTNPPTTAGRAALNAYLDPLIASGALIPATMVNGKPAIAVRYIAGITGTTSGQVHHYRNRTELRMVEQRPGPCPLNVPIVGRVRGKPWRTFLDFNDAIPLMRHLGTAAFIVCSYLTGMRPGEVLGLRAGCCPDPEPDSDGELGRHLIRSVEFKTAIDEHGNHQSAGIEREVPWVAITPVVNAIRVLERMVPDGDLLFSSEFHDLHVPRRSTGSLKVPTVRARIEDFVVWANNEADSHGLINESIPPDPHGKIGTGRFRRSLAWHIARRPNGLVALAIQYGHMRTAVADGYGTRSRGGIHELIDIETALAVADTVAELHDNLETGGGVSGPAARRAIQAEAIAPRFAGTVITATTARRLLANEDAMLYDNPNALLLCHYKRERALCHRDGIKDTPSLDHCVPDCGNIVRTDQQAAQLRRRAELLDMRAAHTPGPLGNRLHANADKLRAYAETHARTRITLDSNSIENTR